MKQGFSTLLYSLLFFVLPAVQAALPSPLKVAISNNTYPYMFINQQGQPEGLVVDYWQHLGQQQQVEIEFLAANWPRTMAMLEQGEVHLHGALAASTKRHQLYQLGDIGVNIYNNIFIHRDMPYFKSVQEVKPLTIGVIERSSHIATLQALIPNVSLAYYADTEAMYDAAINGEIFAFSALDMLPTTYAAYKQLNALFPLYKKMPITKIDLSYAVYNNSALFQHLQLATEQIEPSFIDQLERRWLSIDVEKDTLLLGVPVNNPPFMHISAGGEAKGLMIELWQAWAEQTGKKIAFIPDTSTNNIRSLEQGRIDAIVGLPITDQLPSNLHAAHHIYSFNSQFYYPKERGELRLETLTDEAVAVFQNSPYLAELKQRYPQITFKLYSSLERILSAVQQHEVIGFIGGAAIMPLRLQQLNLAESFSVAERPVIEAALYSLVQKSNQALIDSIHQGFSALPLQQLEAIEQRWLDESEHYFIKFRHKVPLTSAEREWLTAHQPFKLGIVKDWPPMEFVDDTGEPAGITIDNIKLIGQRLGIQFNIQVFNNFAELNTAVKQHKIDVIGSINEVVDGNKAVVLTDKYWSSRWAVISSVASNKINHINQLSGKRIAIYKDYTIVKQLQDYLPEGAIILSDNLKQAINLLQQGEVDAVIETIETSGQFLRDTGYVNLQIQVLEQLSSDPTMFAVRSDYGPLVTIINKSLRSISTESQKQIYDKWFDFQINQGLDKKQFHRLMLQLGGAVSLIIIFFVIWNYSLRKEVGLRRQAEDKMRFMATHDDLTQLPNRSLLKERLEQALLQHARHNEMLALLFIDLDGFKDINDKYGHDVGDELLQNLVSILQIAVRKSDTVSRFGGDEFVVLLTGLLQANDAAIVAEKVLQQLKQSILLSVGPVTIGASIGIAIYPDDGTDSDKLLKVADNLMYRVKQQGKNQYCFSKPGN
jgi:diguanylate cyclase (GGDEF)-like protein